MHKQLENYLKDVEASLSPLPMARRNEELREIRSHLLNAVIVNQEMGQDEEEAIQTAIEQFGEPDECGKGAIWAWQRGENKENKRSFVRAAICAGVLAYLTSSISTLMLHPFYTHGFQSHALPIWLGVFLLSMASFTRMAIVGGISAYVFPKQAMLGSIAAVTAHMAIAFSQQLVFRYSQFSFDHAVNPWPAIAVTLAVNLLILATDLVSVSVSAKVVSRWRLSQLARN